MATMTMDVKRAAAVGVRSRIAPKTMAALFAALRAGIGKFSVIDASLPIGQCAGLDREAIFGCGNDLAPTARQFLERFRQAGGHRDIYLASPSRPLPSTWASLFDSIDRLRKVVVFADSLDQAEAILDLIDSSRSLVIRVSRTRSIITRPAMVAWLEGRRVIALVAPGICFWWVIPTTDFDTVCAALPLEPAPEKRAKSAPPTHAARRPDATFTLAVQTAPPPTTGLVASALVHDGGYRSENEGDYSWIWTGPSNHFRILLTGTPDTPVKLNISVIKTEDPRNLAELRVLVDGRHTPHRLDPWSNLSGKVSVDLGAPAKDMTVLSLVCPHMVPDGAGHRLLGLCIDKIEMIS
ncbi:hypothetical protein FQU96_10080 [Reyranella sp. CPCC 100927]|nr:hypothetical protein FQU96_10080 [Reyranella sp. CPCC 100927]